jgi:hypothetical protein
MTGNTGGGNNHISTTFDYEAHPHSAQTAQQMQIKTADGKPMNNPPATQSGAGAFYPVAGSTTKSGAVSHGREREIEYHEADVRTDWGRSRWSARGRASQAAGWRREHVIRSR